MINKKLAASAASAATAMLCAAEAADGYSAIAGQWRITRAVVAPWTDDPGADQNWIGERVIFAAKSVRGPGPIACRDPKYQATDMPPEGLFQGGLPAPAADAMTSLGVSGATVKGVSLACDTGIFEYHWADDDTLLLALDNRIWTLDRTAGTRAAGSSPEGVVQRFLEAHFAGDMGFAPNALAPKRSFLSKSLRAKIDDYFARPRNPDEAPPINGDPFTDSQEYPTRFAVRADDKKETGVAAPVEFSDAFRARTVLFVMTRESGRWLIDDLRFEGGETLAELLAR